MLRAIAGAGVISTTWANKPASADATAMYLMTDVGESGTLFRYANSRWRAVAGMGALKALGAEVSGIGSSEVIALQTLMPAGAWQTGDILRIRLLGSKSGSANTGTVTVRIGTAGTTADTAISGLSAATIMSAAQQSFGMEFDVKLLSATSAKKIGVNAASTGSYGASSGSAAASATVITDASANALYFSLAVQSGGATDTLTLSHASFHLVTP